MMTLLAYDLHHDTLSDDVDHKLSHETPTMRAKITPGLDAIGGDDSPEAMVVKVCKACMRSAPDEAEFCPECGDELVSIRRVPDMYLEETVGGKYRIVEKVGQGGMGVVYLARNDELGQKVAVKFLSKKFADDDNLVLRFLNEAKSYCRVNHPNAVTLLDYGQHDDGALYIITEFVEGKNVTETLKDKGPLSAETVLDLGIQIAEVLSAAHGQGVIHRDLKPDNIMLMPLSRGRFAVKVLDFGIAKIVDEEDGPNTETGSVFGTPEFMAPEQARGEDADGRSDIYALGVIMFYMITGRLPFRGKNKLVVLNMQLNDPAPRPRDVYPSTDLAPKFESVIMKCLNKGRTQRYDSADDLLEALEEIKIPGGHATDRVGARMTNTTPLINPTIDEDRREKWDEIHTHDETLTSVDTPEEGWEIDSLDMERPPTGRQIAESGPNLAPLVMLVAVLAVAALVVLAVQSEDTPVAPEAPDPVAEQAMASVDDSHRDAVILAVEKLLEEGKLEEARTVFDYSPVTESPARKELNLRLTDLERTRREFDKLLVAGSCAEAQKLAMGVELANLRTVLDERLKTCDGSPTAEGPPTEPTEPTAEKPKPKPKPEPVRDPDPDPQPDPVDVQPDPPDVKEDKLPDDMALPPKTLDEE